MSPTPVFSVTPEQCEFYRTEGYLIVRALWSAQEIADLKQVIDGLAAAGRPIPGYWEPKLNPDGTLDPDPLKRYPRMLHLHRHQPIGLRMMLDPRIGAVARALMDSNYEGYLVADLFASDPAIVARQACEVLRRMCGR